MTRFDEKHPELNGFSEYFDREIRPVLQADEARREAAVKKVKRGVAAIAGTGFIIGILLWLKSHAVGTFIMPAVLGSMGGAAYVAFVFDGIRKDTKTVIVDGICNFAGWEFDVHVAEPPDLVPLMEFGLLPGNYHRVSFEDRLYGEAHGADFEAVECHLERKVKNKNSTSWQTVFQGMIMAIDFHREFLGTTLVLRDAGFFNSKKKMDMKRVGLVDPVFEKIFEAYGTDQVEARYLLTPDFMQQLVDLETSVDGKKIRFAFLNGLLLIVVETPNRFEAGSMFTSLTDPARVQKILDEIAAVYHVIDSLAVPNRRRR